MSMLNHFFNYKPEVLALDEKAMELCQPYFRHMEEIRDFNQLKMLKAFADTQMSSTDMLGTTGYGLWDTGRAKLEQIFAENTITAIIQIHNGRRFSISRPPEGPGNIGWISRQTPARSRTAPACCSRPLQTRAAPNRQRGP